MRSVSATIDFDETGPYFPSLIKIGDCINMIALMVEH